MSIYKKKSVSKKIQLQTKITFRTYPALPYILKWLLICFVVGSCVGSMSAGFLQSLEWVTQFREEHLSIIYLLPVGGLLIGLLYHYFGTNVEAGNNLLLRTIYKPEGKIPLKMAPFVYVGTLVTHLLGGSAGREGTALQMAGAVADQFSKPFRLSEEERKILLIAAIAAGFGSVFGVPLAGAVFGLELVMIGRIRYNAVFPAFMASVIADWVTKLWHTKHTVYVVGTIPDVSLLTVCYAVLAGILFGWCAATFSKSMHALGRFFKAKINYPPLRPFVGGIVVLLVVWLLGTTDYLGLGIPMIEASFLQQQPFYVFALKMAFTIVTLSSGFKGGEVTPLFFIGAALGSALSFFIPLPTGLLAAMGFVAVFAGATNTPLACTLMAMEMFGSECGVFVAIACVVAYLLSGANGIYSEQIIGEPKNLRFMYQQGRSLKDL